MNVYERTQQRLKTVFDLFDNVYVSFSGGKDSGVLLNLCIDYIRRHHLKRRIGVFHMDYEIQYRDTVDYVNRTLAANADILDVYRVCVPFKVLTCTSMFQQYWRPWEESKRELWVREMPADCLTHRDFPFFRDDMWDYEFQNCFAEWLHARNRAARTCCLIGIRTQESFNRWRTIYSDRNHHRFSGKRWIRQWVGGGICNAYPLYDWLTTDIWTANGRFGWPYNRIYDLFYMAGVPLESQRVASPFISQAISSLHLYKAIDPDTWGRMIGRVNGANFAALYGRTAATGWQSVKLPKGMTWEGYMHFLLSTLPERTRNNYLEKLSVSIRFWREKGGCLPDETIAKLQKAGIRIEIGGKSAYRTDKRPGGRLPPLPGAQAVETHLRTGEGPAARGGDRKGHLEPHGLDHPPQPGARHTQRRADERNRRRADAGTDVRPVDHAPHRHGSRRTAAPETDHGARRTLRRQGVQPRRYRGRGRGARQDHALSTASRRIRDGGEEPAWDTARNIRTGACGAARPRPQPDSKPCKGASPLPGHGANASGQGRRKRSPKKVP